MNMLNKVFIAGGAGFIGSHFVDRLLTQPGVTGVTVYDNLSSGRLAYLSHHQSSSKLNVIEGDISDKEHLQRAMEQHHTVIHLASNPDIAKALTEPSVDFDQGTLLTHNILEAMRLTGASKILYASGSGIYGDVGMHEITEDHGPLLPISTYGASKLAGEALISAYCYMFDLKGLVFRFANVVGPRQTHGVGFDFIAKLKSNPNELTILGDGRQSKSYIYVSDVINAVLWANEKVQESFAAFNVATDDYITVTEIAKIAIDRVVGDSSKVKLNYAGGSRGWKGDIPVVRLNTEKIKRLGWRCQHSSSQAIAKSIDEMLNHNFLVLEDHKTNG